MLGVIWQIVRMSITRSIDLKNVPEIANLLQDGEEIHDLLRLPAEAILIRWVNFHLKKNGTD